MCAPSVAARARSLHGAPDTYIVHLPGMMGDTWFDDQWVLGLGDGGAADHMEVYDWTKPNVWTAALQAYAHNRGEARKLAEGIVRMAREHPAARIVLTGESAGCAVAVWALEDLPDDVRVQSVMLVAPAVDPDRDLSRALRHVSGHCYALTSDGDWCVLGWGTSTYGTADGVHTAAAGLTGFQPPRHADTMQYRKLVQIPYDPAWLKYGDLGGHTGGMGRDMARDVLAPLLVADAHPTLRAPEREGQAVALTAAKP